MTSSINYFDEFIKQRNDYREQVEKSDAVISGDNIPLENNPMGLYRWYLHPSMKNMAIRAEIVWVQEIPPGSRSGKLKVQGGQVCLILEGKGYTVIDGERYNWEQYDTLFLPLLPDGTVYQHFNSDPNNWAKILCCEPNFTDALGVDKGCGFEVLENSPDYKS